MGLTQAAFAEQCVLHRTSINTVEHGRRNPGLRNMVIIAYVLNVPLSKLLEGDKGPREGG
jgi:transcriptional regulator with XRE-family HTH domain